ncbi:tigger transposable element-derived protein 1 [Trichonephila clavipes]|nr:tigger transposable element-derived protein 1 [Trichonephila clavipes]
MEKKTHRRQSISLETKIAILDRLGKGEGSTAIGKHFNLGESTVRAIKKNEAAIRKSVISGTKLGTKFASYTRDVLLERTERTIANWIEEQVQRRIPQCIRRSDVEKPLLINKSLRPRALKGKDLKQLPVHWMANPKSWMTTAIFTEWFNNCFVPEVEAYTKEKSLDFKVVLIVDNAASHPRLEHPNLQLVFLPPNTTSLIQPLDQGIIATFKKYHIKTTYKFILNKLENESLTVKDVWKQFSIFDCLIHVASASAQIRPRTLNACWKKICPACVTENTTTQTSTLSDEIINLVHGIGGDGFNTFGHDDIDELLVDDALSDNDIIDLTLDLTVDGVVGLEGDNDEEEKSTPLTGKFIQKGLQLCSKLENNFLINDPNSERASKLQRELQNFMSGYRIILWHDQARRRFVEWAQNEIAVVPDSHKRILFSDEAHFWLNGYVNKQNCRIWSEANPQVYVKTPLHPEKLTVWCALWAGGILQKR